MENRRWEYLEHNNVLSSLIWLDLLWTEVCSRQPLEVSPHLKYSDILGRQRRRAVRHVEVTQELKKTDNEIIKVLGRNSIVSNKV